MVIDGLESCDGGRWSYVWDGYRWFRELLRWEVEVRLGVTDGLESC